MRGIMRVLLEAGYEPKLWTDKKASIFSRNTNILAIGGEYDISNSGEYGEGITLDYPWFPLEQLIGI